MQKRFPYFLALILGCGHSDRATTPIGEPAGDPEMRLNSDFPTVEGEFSLIPHWSFTLPGLFNYRLERTNMEPNREVLSIVIWRPGVTIWIEPWNLPKPSATVPRLKHYRDVMSGDAFEIEEQTQGAVVGLSYRLTEDHKGRTVHAYYACGFTEERQLQISIYLDDEADLALAKELWKSIKAQHGH
jgi:hypothetical protein